MHLLQAKPGGFTAAEGIVDLGQSPGELVILSAADSELALLAHAVEALPEGYPAVRLASLLALRAHASVDLYEDSVLRHARGVVCVLLGGADYWAYGVERLEALARERSIRLALVPGDDAEDPTLLARASVPPQEARRIWRYLREGGPANARALLDFLAARWFDRDVAWAEPSPLPRVAVHHPRHARAGLAHWRAEWAPGAPVAALLFYRAHLQAGNTAAFDAFAEHLAAAGLNPLPIAVASLKDPACLAEVEALLEESRVALILNGTGFAMGSPAAPQARAFARDVPVLQPIFAGQTEDDWRQHPRGLSPSDLAMQIALPEVDGRIITRPVSFKGVLGRSQRAEIDVVGYVPNPERMDFVAQLAQRWAVLAEKPNADKRVALVLANYPTRDGRLGNGVGLDTPASTVAILRALRGAGYPLEDLPADGGELMARLRVGVTNDPDGLYARPAFQSLALADYLAAFARLPAACQTAVRARWGEPCDDPHFRDGRLAVAGIRCGATFVGVQPARGDPLDPAASYHDPDLVPPHGYLAFYVWLREVYRCDAVVHVGKHGNLEWLPGKGVGLSQDCWPDAVFGPLPNVCPFIVNDPGEGAQAKRRAQAVIVDHLIPPLTRAETYGPLRELERLADEYYEAVDVDARRAALLRGEILDRARALHLDRELALASDGDAALVRIDAYLCELKESQIRDGLHVFGTSPAGEQRLDTLLALAHAPHADGKGRNASLIRALARALGLPADYDPLSADPAEPWTGPRPAALVDATPGAWRSAGDTRERLELLARALLAREAGGGRREEICTSPLTPHPSPELEAVLERVSRDIAPALDACGDAELAAVLAALDGRFVPPGPSGAPSRGRLDVLPTGRNFYSVDVRAVPTPTAWRLGWASAAALLERHLHDHGDWPRRLGLSVWGTATMRTGGDDIAQALALLGVRPVWTPGGERVADFEILPLELLDRPRIDVLLRVSGFFRDAFANVIKLFDAAVQAVAALDEPDDSNPIRARVRRDTEAGLEAGLTLDAARRRAGWRVFGAKPGAYGAGLQGPIAERHWETREDLAAAYVNWGGYAYGQHDEGSSAHDTFRARLAGLEAVLHNQDNREHDILDSDDYYQFQGGMIAAVETLAGRRVAGYHADHSLPEAPRVRTLKEELARVVRARALNPKWIAGIKRHGYKGAFELATTVDCLFAFDATTHLVEDYQYAGIAEAYLFDSDTRSFLQAHNPDALRELAERLLEAAQRGLWQEPGDYAARLEDLLLEAERGLEQGG